jgi:hypothetical protein
MHLGMTAKQMAEESADNGEDQTDNQADGIDNHKYLSRLFVRPIKAPNPA